MPMPKYTGHVTMTYRGSVGQSSRHHQANDENDFDSYSKSDRFYVDRIPSVPVVLMPLVLTASLGHGFLFPRHTGIGIEN